MAYAIIERQVEKVVKDTVGEAAIKVMKGVSWLASKQGGATTAENYRLLGKRVLIIGGITLVTAQMVTSIVNIKMARKLEEQRVERIVRRVLAEERQQQVMQETTQEADAALQEA